MMNKKQIDYLLNRYKKYVAIWCEVSVDCVYKWAVRGKIPEKYEESLKTAIVDEFCEVIADELKSEIDDKILPLRAVLKNKGSME